MFVGSMNVFLRGLIWRENARTWYLLAGKYLRTWRDLAGEISS